MCVCGVIVECGSTSHGCTGHSQWAKNPLKKEIGVSAHFLEGNGWQSISRITVIPAPSPVKSLLAVECCGRECIDKANELFFGLERDVFWSNEESKFVLAFVSFLN